MSSVNNNIPFVPENTIDPAAGLNESINVIDALLQLRVLAVKQNAPPASPSAGDRYIVGTSPTGAWVGHALELATWMPDGYWMFRTAWVAVHGTSMVINTGSDWVPATAGSAVVQWGEIAGSIADQLDLVAALGDKVDKVSGKGLSTEDYTTAEKDKLSGIEAGAQVNAVTSVAGKTGAVTLTSADVDLGNVDNTSDATKSIGGNAATATKLQTARTIGGVSFDGTANIDLPGVNTPGNQDTTGTAADSSKLGGQLPAYYATAAQIGDIATALDLINGEVI